MLVFAGIILYFYRNKVTNAIQAGIMAEVRNYKGGSTWLGSEYPRGIRNNNPGNLRISSSAWRGKLSRERNTDGAFEQFYFFENGIRAMIKLIRNYIDSGKNTIRKIIASYAPSSDPGNNESVYISTVVNASGIGADVVLDKEDKERIRLIIKGMAKQENGGDYITDEHFNYAWSIL